MFEIDTHPIRIPSLELINKWADDLETKTDSDVFTEIARWGADQELEACCSLALVDPCCGTKFQRKILVRKIREARRPKPVQVDSNESPTDKQLQETFLEAYYKNKNRQGPDAQAAGLRAVLERWGN